MSTQTMVSLTNWLFLVFFYQLGCVEGSRTYHVNSSKSPFQSAQGSGGQIFEKSACVSPTLPLFTIACCWSIHYNFSPSECLSMCMNIFSLRAVCDLKISQKFWLTDMFWPSVLQSWPSLKLKLGCKRPFVRSWEKVDSLQNKLSGV